MGTTTNTNCSRKAAQPHAIKFSYHELVEDVAMGDEFENTWHIVATVEVEQEEENLNHFSLDIHIEKVTDPTGVQVYPYTTSRHILPKIEQAVRDEYWKRVDGLSQMSQDFIHRHFPENLS